MFGVLSHEKQLIVMDGEHESVEEGQSPNVLKSHITESQHVTSLSEQVEDKHHSALHRSHQTDLKHFTVFRTDKPSSLNTGFISFLVTEM